MNRAAEPLVPELAHLVDHGLQRGALAGQLVLDAGRRLRVAPADDDALRLEPAQPFGERPRADARTGMLELGEPPRALREVVDEQHRPLRADDLARGREYVLSVVTPQLSAGTHRFALIVFDDDELPGLFGWHDLLADVYVGGTPAPLKLPAPRETSTRPDAAIANANYGVWMTVLADRLRLAGNVNWHDGLELYASVYGSPREDGRPAALVLLQNFEQQGRPVTISTRAGRVAVVPFRPRRPSSDFEPIRAVIYTNPDRELAPSGSYNQQDLFASFASQKAYLRTP